MFSAPITDIGIFWTLLIIFNIPYFILSVVLKMRWHIVLALALLIGMGCAFYRFYVTQKGYNFNVSQTPVTQIEYTVAYYKQTEHKLLM